MSIVVKKFGGSSVGSIEKIQKIAFHISEEITKGDDIVVVVSAMGKTTDDLFHLAYQITKTPNQREMDMLVTAGERITMALLSLSLQQLNIQSISFTGSQSGIITDNSHGNAKILTINAYRIPEELKKGKIVIVAGFQGVSMEKEITTLGRGGSDTTAIALACYLKAKKCEIFTDVEGVFTADPRIVKGARKLKKLSSEEMLFLSFNGSKVLHKRASEFAHKYKIPTEVKSSTEYKEGTMIEQKMETSTVKAISHKENIVIVEIEQDDLVLPDFSVEIFDIEITSDTAKIYVEQQYYDILMNEYYDSYTGEEDSLVVSNDKGNSLKACITLLGYRICKDFQFINELRKTISETIDTPYLIKNQGIGVQVIINQSELEKVIQVLHNKYVEGQEL